MVQAGQILRKLRKFTRYILGFPSEDYYQRLCNTKLLPLSYRREVNDLFLLYKCINGIYKLDISMYVKFNNVSYRTRSSNDKLKLCVPHCKTVTGKKLYFNRVIKLWNALPQSLREENNVRTFRKKLYIYYNDNMFHANFDSDNVCTWTLSCSCNKCSPC